MNVIVWLLMLTIFFYTTGFSIQLWKEQNKVGAIAAFMLAISVVISPFFSVLRW
ncbi:MULTISPECIES: hypothetical protein [Lysinibacillus]|uniref:hypothetical protein n=1 Tax=Lysinibacillus TaxID=400634 RepID=UPI00131A4594|nr:MULTISPECIES: hypothetical protein [Lysinibacillus]